MTILFVYIYATYKPYYYFNYKNNVKKFSSQNYLAHYHISVNTIQK